MLCFAKPERAIPIEQWKGISAEGAPPGVYTSNMSAEDRRLWKAKLVGIQKGDFQIEIRSEAPGANLFITVNGPVMPSYPRAMRGRERQSLEPGLVRMTTNGPLLFSPHIWEAFQQAVAEANSILADLHNPTTRDSTLTAIRAGRDPYEIPF